MDKNIQKDYMAHKAWGLSCSVDLRDCNPEKIRSAAVIQDYVIQLCKLIDMVRFGDCQITNFGSGDKAGFTLIQLIETSNITGHFSNDMNAAFIDVFSCKVFSPYEVGDFTKQFFDGGELITRWIFRK
jgi:S-adenosylmethionine/arginine decarboxylase-like enzyme